MKYTVIWKTAKDRGSRTFLLPSEAKAEREWLIKSGIPEVCVRIEVTLIDERV